jgi:chorismate synthase
VFEGRTTGTPIGLLIVNADARSKDYSAIKDLFRPGHADYTYHAKYGTRDYRGGGRSSARETAIRVAAGAIARKILGPEVNVRGALVQMGPHRIDRGRWDWDEVARNPFWCPDAVAAAAWETFLDGVRKSGLSAGAVVEVVASGVPVGLGEPTFDRLDADIAKALVSIPAAKGVEIGAGFDAVAMTGLEHNDEMRMVDGKIAFLSNNAGGVLGGISSGQDIVARLAIKPTSSISVPQRTVTAHGEDAEIVTKGRHDPCVGIRGVPVAEAMLACVLADHLLRHRAQGGQT